MNYNFYMPVDIRFGEDALSTLTNEIDDKNVFIVTDKVLVQNGIVDTVTAKIRAKNISIFDQIEPNPSTDTINKASNTCRLHSIDTIIAIGGGSALDTAKCVAILSTNEGVIEEYIKGKSFCNKPLPLICLPTTAGTGSEVTNVSVLTNKKENTKTPLVRDELWSKYACIVPSLTHSMPKHITAETGWDSFSHALEAYWSKSSNPISDSLALKSMSLIFDNIESAYLEPQNIKARENMSLASLLAGIAFSQTRTTAMHATSFCLTSDYKLSHGRACAITMLGFLDYCNGFWDDKQDILLKRLNLNNFIDFIKLLENKLINTQMPIKLSEVGITKDNIEKLAESGLKYAILHQIPREINKENLVKVLKSII